MFRECTVNLRVHNKIQPFYCTRSLIRDVTNTQDLLGVCKYTNDSVYELQMMDQTEKKESRPEFAEQLVERGI